MVDDTRTMYWTLQLAFIMALIAAMTMRPAWSAPHLSSANEQSPMVI
jgi:hypothetical protein